MTSVSPFFTFNLSLVFLFFLLTPISPFTFSNFEILDLGATSLASEASAWTVTNQLSASAVTTCSGSEILGGYGVVGTGGTFSRLYTSLPPHDVIYFSISFWIIDLESAQDLFKIYFDTQLVNTYASPNIPYGYASSYTNICGGSLKDYPSLIVNGKVPHTSSQLTLKIVSLFDSSTDSFSFGFRDISLLLKNTTTTPSLSYCTFALGSSGSSCLCPAKSYNPPGSYSCSACNSACETCLTGASSDCTSCPSGYSFNGATCIQCDSSCSTCTGSGSNQCVTCSSSNNFLYWNGSCLATCDSPFIQGSDVNKQKTCELPCGTSGFLYQNGTCNSTCNWPFVQGTTSNGVVKTCNFKCTSPQFLYPNNTCQGTCDAPLIKSISGYERYCDSPCPTSEFIYADGSCSAGCDSPFVERLEGGLKYCDKPCPDGSYLYWNGSCIAYCPLAFQEVNNTVDCCNFYCPLNEYLYWNQTCNSSCDQPLVQSIDSESYQYCSKPCSNDEEFYYQNNSCYSFCPEPYESSTFEGVSLCNSPCLLDQFYYEKTSSCLDSCDSPRVSSQVGLLKICSDGAVTTPPTNQTTDNFTLSGSVGKLTSAVSAAAGFIRPSGGNSVFMVALAKMLRYVIYLDIQLPDTLLESFQSKNSGAFSISTTYSYPMPDSLKNMYKNGTLPELLTGKDEGTSYLINQWESLSTFSLVIAMGIFFSLFEGVIKNSKHKVLVCVITRLRIITKWNFFLFLFFNGFDNVTLYAIMEIKTLRLDSFANILSFAVCILTTALALYILMQTFRISWETQRRKGQIAPENKPQASFYSKWQAFQGLYAGLKDGSLLQHAYLFIFACRIIACYLIVGFLYAYPVVQTTLFSVFSVLMMYYLLKLRPVKDFINFLIAISFEILILAVNFSILLVAILDHYGNSSRSIRNPIYYIILFSNTAVQMLGNATVFIYIICGFYNAYKTSKSPGIMPKTSYISAFVSVYQNPGMDFADESYEDLDNPTIKIIVSAASLNAQQKIREKPERLSRSRIRPLITKKSSLALTEDTEALSQSRSLTEKGSCGLKDGDTISNLIHIWPAGQSKVQPKRSSLFKTRRGSGISEITMDSEVEISIGGGQSQALDNLLAESTPKCENLSVKNTERQGNFSPSSNGFSPSQNRQQKILSLRKVGSMAPIFKKAPVVESVIMEEVSPYIKQENETEVSQRSRANSRESNNALEGSQKNLDGVMVKSQFFARKVSEDLGMFDIEKSPLAKTREKRMLNFDFCEDNEISPENKSNKRSLKPPSAQTTRQRAPTVPIVVTRSTLSNDVKGMIMEGPKLTEEQDLLSTTLEMELKKPPEKFPPKKKFNEASTRTSITQNVLPTVRGSLVVEDVRDSGNSFVEKRREFARQSTIGSKSLIGRLMAPYQAPITISSFSGEQQQEESKSSQTFNKVE